MVNGLQRRLERIEVHKSPKLDRGIGSAYATISSEIGHKFSPGYIACCCRVVGYGDETRWADGKEGRVPTGDEILTAEYWKWVDRFGEALVSQVIDVIASELEAGSNNGYGANV